MTDSVIVPGAGRLPNLVLLCGESPGAQEAEKGEPFVGRSGIEQQWYLSRHNLNVRNWYRTNVSKRYYGDNRDPSREDIEEWTPVLLSEVAQCAPRLIIAVGRFATRWFLGEQADMDTCHGIPHLAGAFDTWRAGRAPKGCIILPVIHPASGFYDNDAKALIAWDYGRVADVLARIKHGVDIDLREDTRAGKESYDDVTGAELENQIWQSGEGISLSDDSYIIAIDTEGIPSNPWSIQVSVITESGLVLRCSQPDFKAGVDYIKSIADRPTCTVVMHNAMYDLEMCAAMGLDLSRARIFDTMYAAYLLRLEPQGLKPLAWRWCGIKMQSYKDVVGDVCTEKQVAYLARALDRSPWPIIEPRVIHDNNGTDRVYKPQSIELRIAKILSDYANDDPFSEDRMDVHDRWSQVDKELRSEVENVLGPMPIGTLADIPLDRAVIYAARDSDATLRLHRRLVPELARLDLTRTMGTGMRVLPIFEEMQRNGMPASRRYFERFSRELDTSMREIGTRISTQYFDGRPFNPASSKQVATLMRRRGLTAEKRTSTGAMSTGKQSIEHLRYTDPAISDVFDWRERQHLRDSFCAPVLARIPEDKDICPIRSNLKVTRTATRRLAATDPNLLAIPVREYRGSEGDLGRRVREGYQCPDGEVFGAWDLSAIEMRYLAHETEDELLGRLFREKRDIHSETAARIFRLDPSTIDEDTWKFKYRLPAKNAGFGIVYGIQGQGLLTQLRMLGITGWDERSCAKLIDDWLNMYGGVKEYIARTIKEVQKCGYARDSSGMYRYLPGIWSNDRKVAAEAGRIAVSHKIQGGAQTLIQNSMAYLHAQIRDLQDTGANVVWRMQIHDELLLSFTPDLWEPLDYIVRDALVNHSGIDLRVPIECEGAQSTNWANLK
jgi:uracil-DNA glycosylase family 4